LSFQLILKENEPESPDQDLLILISLWVINGSSFLAIKVAIDTIPPLLSAGLRFSLAGAILFRVYFLQVNRYRLREHH
jgi:drug/metabolite transporter (DMT)-like permease